MIRNNIQTVQEVYKPIKLALWRNLIVLKCGKSYIGIKTFISEEEAKKQIDIGMSMIEEVPCFTVIDGPILGVMNMKLYPSVYKRDISFVIQVPQEVKDHD